MAAVWGFRSIVSSCHQNLQAWAKIHAWLLLDHLPCGLKVRMYVCDDAHQYSFFWFEPEHLARTADDCIAHLFGRVSVFMLYWLKDDCIVRTSTYVHMFKLSWSKWLNCEVLKDDDKQFCSIPWRWTQFSTWFRLPSWALRWNWAHTL